MNHILCYFVLVGISALCKASVRNRDVAPAGMTVLYSGVFGHQMLASLRNTAQIPIAADQLLMRSHDSTISDSEFFLHVASWPAKGPLLAGPWTSM